MCIFSLCTRRCWVDQHNNILKTWERREAAGHGGSGVLLSSACYWLGAAAICHGLDRELESCEENVMGMAKWGKVQLAKAETTA